MATDDRRPMSGAELALRLLGAFRGLVDELHAELASRGHPDVRPAHGFALQALGPDGATAAELGTRLGVSKQAAGKTVERLLTLGYAERRTDPGDGRRKVVTASPLGRELLGLSAEIFGRLRATHEERLGSARMHELEEALRALTDRGSVPLDAVAWFDAPDV